MATTSTTYTGYDNNQPLTHTELTQRTMLDDLRQQPLLLAGAAVGFVALVLFLTRRKPSRERAARQLVREWRDVDDADDARDVLGSNLPVILRPAAAVLLDEAEHVVHRWFRQLERAINKL